MLEGSRAFDIVWGSVTGAICFLIGGILIAQWVRARRSGAASIFGRAIDPSRRLHFAYAVASLAMGGTNVGCRYIDHRYLSGVHEGYFAMTLTIVAILVPPLVARVRRGASFSRS